MKRQIQCLFTCFILFVVFISPAKLLAVPYYEGKVIKLIVGSEPGGGYDTMARLIAKHLPKHIAGKPSVVVQNMPGASHMIAANYLYNICKPDGLTIGLLSKGLVVSQLMKIEGVRFDLTKFEWIGSSAIDFGLVLIRSDLPYKTFNDLLNAGKPIFMAGSGPASPNTQITLFLKDFCGLDAKLVDYRSGGDIWLALMRKECDGVYSPLNSGKPYIESGLVRPILRNRLPRPGILELPAEIENLPTIEDLFTDPLGKLLIGIYAANDYAARCFRAPPKTPANLMYILKDAFAKAIKDPELQADAEKLKVQVTHVSGEEVLKAINYILNQPPEVVKAFSKYVKF